MTHFVIQTDLTAVTAGPLEHTVDTELRMLADQESRGVGGVYRFSTTSLGRAFDLGWSAAEVRLWLERHSTTDVPQALLYLVGDAARRHGSIRVGPAGCYVRVADEAQAAALLAHPTASDLGLRSVAPGVLVAAVDEHELVPLLRELGHSPAVENAAGELILARPSRRATPGGRASQGRRFGSRGGRCAAGARTPPSGQRATRGRARPRARSSNSGRRLAQPCRYEWSMSTPTAAGSSASWRLWISPPVPYAPSTATLRRSSLSRWPASRQSFPPAADPRSRVRSSRDGRRIIRLTGCTPRRSGE